MDVTDLLKDLLRHGAESCGRLQQILPRDQLEELLEEKTLRRHATPAGEGIVLGPQGRRALGLSPHYLSPPDVAATQILRRRLREKLEADGYRYLGTQGRTLLVFRSSRGRRAYLMAQWHPYRARSVSRTLARIRVQLLCEGAVLLVATKQPYYLRHLQEASGGLVELLAY